MYAKEAGLEQFGRERPVAPHHLLYFTEMCSGFEAGSYLRLIDFVYHSTLGLRVNKKMRRTNRQ